MYDRYSNLLRVTTEAMAAAIGGCQRLTVEPFGFDAHLALNVQRILRDEAHLDAVADPAGGSYYIEALTDAVAREAWKLFQQVEAEGGYAKAWHPDRWRGRWRQTRAARAKAVRHAAPHAGGGQQLSQPEGEDRGGGSAGRSCERRHFPAFRLAEPFEEDPPADHAARGAHRPHIPRSCCSSAATSR